MDTASPSALGETDMYVSMSFLIAGLLLLVLFASVLYLNNTLMMRYRVRPTAVDICLLALQVFNLSLLPQRIIADNEAAVALSGHYELLVMEVVFITFLITRLQWLLLKLQKLRRNMLTPQSIRETIDFLPGGICFSDPDGRPILTNYKMNELVYRLTGHTIMNARATLEELQHPNAADGCELLEEPWLHQSGGEETTDESMYFLLPDKAIWRFRKEELKDRPPSYVQLEATEITDLYRYSQILYENNRLLAEQYARQQSLLASVIEINHEKELLATKMRIHDDLGRSILTTKQHLLNGTLHENIAYLADIWSNAISNLADFPGRPADGDISPEAELQRAADMIGCSIRFYGERPPERKAALLLYAAVREALTNAVLHAGADQLDVAIEHTEDGYHVEISDNGAAPISDIKEGSGLSNLRKKLEQEGATLWVKRDVGVVLLVELPA